MPRVVKEAAVRRSEILDAAYQLFVRDGYDATTVNALIEALGISKGAFYHHFESKDEVMQALARRMAEEMRAKVEPVLARPGLSSVDKLNLMFSFGAKLKREHVPLVHAMAAFYYREENLRLRARIIAESTAVMGPLFARILDEGQRDGSFTVDDPVETARLLIHLGTFLHDAFGDAWQRAANDLKGAAAQFRRRVEAYARAFERILGLDEHTLSLIDDRTIKLFLNLEKT
jgi:AcrR family transcriptional regulator